MMVCDKLIDNLAACAQGMDRCFLVGLHEPAILDHVGAQDSGKPAFHTVPGHGSTP
jgi:hypothetical protein